ncbi:MAG TPA: PH domain-containing protein [Flavobacteriaceae bacterium]|nr:PH domain-containing protein [Flavobacteriaceae bacterium]
MQDFTNNSIDLASLPDYREVDFRSISKKYLTKSLLQLGITFLVLLAGWAMLFFFEISNLFRLLSLGILLAFFAFFFWNMVQLQKKYGFALREKDILYRRGFLVNKITVVPFNRIQHVSTTRGILDKKLGIATLNIFTAGGSGSDIKIPGLEPELAFRLKEAVAVNLKMS